MEEIEYYLKVENIQDKIDHYLCHYSPTDVTYNNVLKLQKEMHHFTEIYMIMVREGRKQSFFRDCISSNVYVTTIPDTCYCVKMYLQLAKLKQIYLRVFFVLK